MLKSCLVLLVRSHRWSLTRMESISWRGVKIIRIDYGISEWYGYRATFELELIVATCLVSIYWTSKYLEKPDPMFVWWTRL